MQGKKTNSTRAMLGKIYKHGVGPIIFVVAFGILLIIVNYIISLQTLTYDMSRNKTNTLSSATHRLLTLLDFDVDIIAFYSEGYQRRIGLVLEKYEQQTDGLNVRFVDPIKNPLAAEEYGVEQSGTIILEGAGRQTRINSPQIGEENGESEITIALFRLFANQEEKKLYFTTGHGEYNIFDTNPMGLSNVREKLEEQNYIVENINLLEHENIPDDCTSLIIAGPTVPFTNEEAAIIDRHLNRQGAIFVMVNPRLDANMNEFMDYYGLRYGDDYIYETSSKLTTEMGGPLYPFVTPVDSSEITENLDNQMFMFPFVRSIHRPAAYDEVRVARLLATSENSWAETDLDSSQNITNVKPTRDGQEIKGPLNVAVTTEREFSLPDSIRTTRNPTYWVRSAFFGNATFATNSIVTTFTPNLTLFLNTVNWVSRNEEIIDVTPNTDIFTPVELTQSDRRLISWLTIVLFPVAILAVGIVVWYRKR